MKTFDLISLNKWRKQCWGVLILLLLLIIIIIIIIIISYSS